MKKLFLFSFLVNFIICQFNLKEDEGKLDYYINYTLIPPQRLKIKKYYIEPNFDVGTLDFIIYFSSSSLACTFDFYNGENLFDQIKKYYTLYTAFTLKVPESKPSIIRMEVSNYNHEDPYYMYIYNKNYQIPLIFPNHYIYQISVKELNITYKINDITENNILKLEAKIQYPQYKDSLNIKINDGGEEYSHSFSETSSFEFSLLKNKEYKLTLWPDFKSEFTNYTYFFITFEKDQNFPILFYKNSLLTIYNNFINK